MNKLTRVTLTLLLTLGLNTLSAHSLWIETAATGKAGQAQNVKLFFGEYGQQERDELDKWHSDLKELTLWLTGPDGHKEKLTISQGANYCEANFTPEQDGVYTLLVNHKIKDMSGTSQLEFLASTNVVVGKPVKSIDPATNTNELKVLPVTPAKLNAPVKVKVWLKGEAKAGLSVLLFSPINWGQELTTDADGTVSFTPLWPGKYVIEAMASTGPGEFNGNKYTSLWQGATYSFDVSK